MTQPNCKKVITNVYTLFYEGDPIGRANFPRGPRNIAITYTGLFKTINSDKRENKEYAN